MLTMFGPFVVVSGVLAVGGLAKLRDPRPSTAAIWAMGWRVPPSLLRLLGALEVSLAVLAVLIGGRLLPAAVALFYVGFAGFVGAAMRADIANCGCFGAADAPPGRLHIIVNLVAAAIAATAAVVSIASLSAGIAAQPAFAIPFVVVAMCAIALTIALLTVLPEALHRADDDATHDAPRPFALTPRSST